MLPLVETWESWARLHPEGATAHGDLHTNNVLIVPEFGDGSSVRRRAVLIDLAVIDDVRDVQRINYQLVRIQAAVDAEMYRRAIMQMVVVDGKQTAAAVQASFDSPRVLTRRDEWERLRRRYNGAGDLDSFFVQDPVKADESWCLPSITTGLDSHVTKALSSLTVAQLRALATNVAKIQHVVMRLLQELIEPRPHGLREHHPPSSASPCGVISRATPRVPRAPGKQLFSDAFSQPLAVAVWPFRSEAAGPDRKN